MKVQEATRSSARSVKKLAVDFLLSEGREFIISPSFAGFRRVRSLIHPCQCFRCERPPNYVFLVIIVPSKRPLSGEVGVSWPTTLQPRDMTHNTQKRTAPMKLSIALNNLYCWLHHHDICRNSTLVLGDNKMNWVYWGSQAHS